MEALSRERLSASAFRVLGLPAGASQADVDAAARRMRIWPAPRSDPAHAMGPAVARPRPAGATTSSRPSPSSTTPSPASAKGCSGSPTRRPPAARRAVVSSPASAGRPSPPNLLPRTPPTTRLSPLSPPTCSPTPKSPATGVGQALAGLIRATTDRGYRDWFLAVERDGDFEKRTEPREVLTALAGFSDWVTNALAARAREALDDDRADACVRLVGLLRAAAPPGAPPPRGPRPAWPTGSRTCSPPAANGSVTTSTTASTGGPTTGLGTAPPTSAPARRRPARSTRPSSRC